MEALPCLGSLYLSASLRGKVGHCLGVYLNSICAVPSPKCLALSGTERRHLRFHVGQLFFWGGNFTVTNK